MKTILKYLIGPVYTEWIFSKIEDMDMWHRDDIKENIIGIQIMILLFIMIIGAYGVIHWVIFLLE